MSGFCTICTRDGHVAASCPKRAGNGEHRKIVDWDVFDANCKVTDERPLTAIVDEAWANWKNWEFGE